MTNPNLPDEPCCAGDECDHTPPVTMADLSRQLDDVRQSIANAETMIAKVAEQVGPLVDRLASSPLIRMIGGK